MSNAINEIDNTDLVFVFGYNPADSHPIVANHVINAKRNGAKIIVCDPRKIETARIADMHIALKNGSNIALLNAMGHVIIEENLYDKAFVASRTEGFEEYRKIVEGYTPESVEDITGVSASEIRQAARMYAQAKSAAILWGMGVTQFYQGVETVRSLTSLAMLTGNLGKPHAGVNPVRGQNNVQGACDMGALPDTYPGYQYVKDPANREKFAKAWGVESLPAHTGYRISELPHRAAHGEVRAAYIMGEDPLQTDAELSAVRKAFEDLELVIVQDIFMTKTASAADVILPSTSWGEHEGVFTAADRGFQRFFKAVEPKWDLKTDWQFDTPNGLAQFFTCDWVAPIDKLTDEYPMVLSTVREVGHYSCRSMTGNCAALAALADEPGYAQINTEDAKRLGIEDEALVWVHSRKGKIITRAQVSDRPNKGAIYMTYQWWIGACNELVTENLSPITKTPEYKYCAVRVESIADQRAAEQYVIDEYNKLKTRLREAALA